MSRNTTVSQDMVDNINSPGYRDWCTGLTYQGNGWISTKNFRFQNNLGTSGLLPLELKEFLIDNKINKFLIPRLMISLQIIIARYVRDVWLKRCDRVFAELNKPD